MRRVLKALLTLLGFTGCDLLVNCCAYGTPYAEFELKGTVSDGKELIENVEVSFSSSNPYLDNHTMITDHNGKFVYKDTYTEAADFQYTLIANDLNGKYESDTIKGYILLSDFKRKKRDDKWFDGKATKTENFILKEKNGK